MPTLDEAVLPGQSMSRFTVITMLDNLVVGLDTNTGTCDGGPA
jgi:hypothetical protein